MKEPYATYVRLAESVACSTCKAEPGQPCVTNKGVPVQGLPHTPRYAEYRKQKTIARNEQKERKAQNLTVEERESLIEGAIGPIEPKEFPFGVTVMPAEQFDELVATLDQPEEAPKKEDHNG